MIRSQMLPLVKCAAWCALVGSYATLVHGSPHNVDKRVVVISRQPGASVRTINNWATVSADTVASKPTPLGHNQVSCNPTNYVEENFHIRQKVGGGAGNGDGYCRCTSDLGSYVVTDMKQSDKCGYDKLQFLCAVSPDVAMKMGAQATVASKEAWHITGGDSFFNGLIKDGIAGWAERLANSDALATNGQSGTNQNWACDNILVTANCASPNRQVCQKYDPPGAYFVQLQVSNWFQAMNLVYQTQLGDAIGAISHSIKDLINTFGIPQVDQTTKIMTMIINAATMVVGINDFINPANAMKPVSLGMSILSNSISLYTNNAAAPPSKEDIDWNAEDKYGAWFDSIRTQLSDSVSNVWAGKLNNKKDLTDIFGDGKFLDSDTSKAMATTWSTILSRRAMEAVMVQVLHTAKDEWDILVVPENAPFWNQVVNHSKRSKDGLSKRVGPEGPAGGQGGGGGGTVTTPNPPDHNQPMNAAQCGKFSGCVWYDQALAGRENLASCPNSEKCQPQGTAGCVCITTQTKRGDDGLFTLMKGDRLNTITSKLIGDNAGQQMTMLQAALKNNVDCHDDSGSAWDGITNQPLAQGTAYPSCFWNLPVFAQYWWTGVESQDNF